MQPTNRRVKRKSNLEDIPKVKTPAQETRQQRNDGSSPHNPQLTARGQRGSLRPEERGQAPQRYPVTSPSPATQQSPRPILPKLNAEADERFPNNLHTQQGKGQARLPRAPHVPRELLPPQETVHNTYAYANEVEDPNRGVYINYAQQRYQIEPIKKNGQYETSSTESPIRHAEQPQPFPQRFPTWSSSDEEVPAFLEFRPTLPPANGPDGQLQFLQPMPIENTPANSSFPIVIYNPFELPTPPLGNQNPLPARKVPTDEERSTYKLPSSYAKQFRVLKPLGKGTFGAAAVIEVVDAGPGTIPEEFKLSKGTVLAAKRIFTPPKKKNTGFDKEWKALAVLAIPPGHINIVGAWCVQQPKEIDPWGHIFMEYCELGDVHNLINMYILYAGQEQIEILRKAGRSGEAVR
ncbi:hypothetical protein ABW19_dt0200914 [Dactylella cylindrospora]|nr:hypothetical protein ABW19_dt0200914 [Dactylella cylindrospora]